MYGIGKDCCGSSVLLMPRSQLTESGDGCHWFVLWENFADRLWAARNLVAHKPLFRGRQESLWFICGRL